MQDMHEIEDNLRVIRRLMERGQRYEAITGRGALVAGIAAFAVAALVEWIRRSDPFSWGHERTHAFVLAWPLLAVVSAAWLVLAALRIPADPEDDASRRLSASARSVCRAVLPAYLLAAALTLCAEGLHPQPPSGLLAGAWTALHGIAILATAYHAPRRLVVLGWIFLAYGCAALVATAVLGHRIEPSANLIAAVGFGGLHLAYGLYSVLRPLPAED